MHTRTPTHTFTTDLAELLALEELTWPERLAALRAEGCPVALADDADPDPDDEDTDDAETEDDAKPNGKDKAPGKGDEGDEDDDDNSPLGLARKAAAKANGELKRMKDEAKKAETKAAKDAGKWKDLYDAANEELEQLKAERATEAKTRLVEAALAEAKVKISPARAARLLDLDEIEDQLDAERAVRALKKSDPTLFASGGRQIKGAGRGGKNTDTDDSDDTKPKQPGDRLRRGLATSKT